MRLDNFLKIHINSILGSSNIIEGKKKLDSQSTISNKSLIFELNLHSNIINEYSEHLSLVSDIMNDNDKIVKNLKGLGRNVGKKKKGTYLDKNPKYINL